MYSISAPDLTPGHIHIVRGDTPCATIDTAHIPAYLAESCARILCSILNAEAPATALADYASPLYRAGYRDGYRTAINATIPTDSEPATGNVTQPNLYCVREFELTFGVCPVMPRDAGAVAVFCKYIHPDPKSAAEAECERLNEPARAELKKSVAAFGLPTP